MLTPLHLISATCVPDILSQSYTQGLLTTTGSSRGASSQALSSSASPFLLHPIGLLVFILGLSCPPDYSAFPAPGGKVPGMLVQGAAASSKNLWFSRALVLSVELLGWGEMSILRVYIFSNICDLGYCLHPAKAPILWSEPTPSIT